MTGAIIDDGVACRLAPDWFYITATTSGVEALYRAMLRWNAQWRMAVDIANVTAAYAAVNIAGPLAREVLQRLPGDVDLPRRGFPYLAVREGTLAGVPVRLLRVGFVGEIGYQIHCPASYGAGLWELLVDAGAAAGLRPFGVEAQRTLRLEKGPRTRQDTDGLTFPHEAGMAWVIGAKKPFFVGDRAIRVQSTRPLARRLVCFTRRLMLTSPARMLPRDPGRRHRRPGHLGGPLAGVWIDRRNRLRASRGRRPGKALLGQARGRQSDRADGRPMAFDDPDGRRQEL